MRENSRRLFTRLGIEKRFISPPWHGSHVDQKELPSCQSIRLPLLATMAAWESAQQETLNAIILGLRITLIIK